MKIKPDNVQRLPLKPVHVRIQANNLIFGHPGQVTDPISRCNKALAMDPACVYAHVVLGQHYMNHNQWKAALPHYQAAVAQAYAAPKDRWEQAKIMLRMQLGNVYGEVQQLDKEEEETRKALSLAPYYLHARFNLGQALLRQGRFEEALQEIQLALDTGSDPRDKWTAQPTAILQYALQVKFQILDGIAEKDQDALAHMEEAPTRDMAAQALEHVQNAIKCLHDHPGEPFTSEHEAVMFVREAYYLNYQAVVFQDVDAASKVGAALDRAMKIVDIPPPRRGYVLHKKAKLLELQADFVDSPDKARGLYQEALDVVTESQRVCWDKANLQSMGKLKTKLNPDMIEISRSKNPMAGAFMAKSRTGEDLVTNTEGADAVFVNMRSHS
jgi:tetratricopeptide (TPR) repeat protein